MMINFSALTDTLYALATLTGLAILVAIGIVGAAAVTERGKARHAGQAGPAAGTAASAPHPTQFDRSRQFASR
jgi:hypothetical protein